MFTKLFTSLFGSRNDRQVRRMSNVVERINALESEFEAHSDDALIAMTATFRQRFAEGETLDDLLPEAFAAVREASKRAMGMRHYDVQLIGGMVLHSGKIAEMRTGEGKTLVATLPAYLNSLSGQSVHIITVNDYLAARDGDWMRPVYEALGLTVGIVIPNMSPAAKRAAYACDVVYGTNNEFGFDYLRDNMAFTAADRVIKDQAFAIIDEVDSILIDEARTPLIISGPTDDSPQLYVKVNRVVPMLKVQQTEDGEGDYSVDEKMKQIHLTEDGMEHVEKIFVQQGLIQAGESLYDPQHLSLVHHLNAAIRAHALYNKDVEYLIDDGEVVIVDEFTGRTLKGRRWSDGLHQAIEAKEGVPIQKENQTLASITFQNLFRLYDKLSGMTGTADTEAYEFQQIYGLEVIVIPTHKPMIRNDENDLIYVNKAAKFNAILEDIRDCQTRQQPVLIGTTSIDYSEELSRELTKVGVKHEVLNAKQHQRESIIVAQAGRPGAVTIATNMAGRGTDIVLGGNPESDIEALGEDASDDQIAEARAQWKVRHQQVLDAGGLHIIGTERHESRRVDNQLRGRSGRQGDPGSSRFYVSFEDNLIRIFASDRVQAMMQKSGMGEDEVIQNKIFSRLIENAQRKVEAMNFDARKNLLEYDDVANDQRRVIYRERNELMDSDDISDQISTIRETVFDDLIDSYIPPDSIDEQWDVAGLEKSLEADFGLNIPLADMLKRDESMDADGIRDAVHAAVEHFFSEKEDLIGPKLMRNLEKTVMLQELDRHWKEHLANMDYLRRGIGLRGYAQKQPKQEYKREAFELFTKVLGEIDHDVIQILARIRIQAQEDVDQVAAQRQQQSNMQFNHPQAGAGSKPAPAAPPPAAQPFVREGAKVGRNDPCPCGSGKKYKQCHGKLG